MNSMIPKTRVACLSACLVTVFFLSLGIVRAQTWEWDFGDGSPKEYTQNPLHTYWVGTWT